MTAFYINSWRFHAGWVLWAVWFYCLCSTEEATGSLLSVVQDRISGHRVKNWFSSVLSTDYLCRVNQLTGHTLEVNNQKGGRGAFYVTEDLVLVGHEWGGPDPWGVMWSEVKAWMRTSHSFRRSSDPEQIGHKLCIPLRLKTNFRKLGGRTGSRNAEFLKWSRNFILMWFWP